jgi:hypothetical protein
MRVHRAVRQDQVEPDPLILAFRGLVPFPGGIATRELQVLPLTDREADVDRIDVRQRVQHHRVGALPDIVPNLGLRQSDHAFDRSLDPAVGKVDLGQLQDRLGGFDLGGGCLFTGDGAVEIAPADGVHLRQRAIAGDVRLRIGQLGPGSREAGPGRVHLLQQLRLVDAVEQLSLLDPSAFAEVDTLEIACHPGADLDVRLAAGLADPLADDRHVADGDLGDEHLERRRRRPLRLAGAGGRERQRHHQLY